MKQDHHLSLLFMALLCAGVSAFGESPGLSDLDALTDRWIDLRGTLAEEKRLWTNRKAAWEDEIALLEEQARILGGELDATREVLSSAGERQAETLARRDSAAQELEEVGSILDRAARDVRVLAEAIPPSLLAGLPNELRAFAEDGAADLPRVQRAQRLVAFLSGLESMQNRFHATRETLEAEGQRRQVDVLYIGLARGFAVSPANDWAAVGVPAAGGWRWTPQAVDPRDVRRALDVYNRQETAALVSLPLKVEEGP